MDRIDTQMLKIYKESTKKHSMDGKKVSPEEASALILRAEELNQSSSGSCFRSSSRGTKNLKKLVKSHKDDFSHESRDLIKTYTKTGHLPHFETHSGNMGQGLGIYGNGQSNWDYPPPPTGNPQRPGAGFNAVPSSGLAPHRPVNELPPPNNYIPASSPVIINPPNSALHVGAPALIRPPRPSIPSGDPVVARPPTMSMPSVSPVVVGPSNPGMPSIGPVVIGPSNPGISSGAPVVVGPARPSVPSSHPVGRPPRPNIPSGGSVLATPPNASIPASGPVVTPPSPGRPGIPAIVPPAPVTPAPVAPAPVTAAPVTAAPVTAAPVTPAPVAPQPAVPSLGNIGSGIEGPKGKEILSWKSAQPTSFYHWFPLQETRPGGDSTNNLYAVGGALDKLDMISGSKARQYEFDHNRKAVDAGKEYGWWGHCDKASTLACILEAPKHGVVMTDANGKKVNFTKNDIQGLLVKVAQHLATQVDFRGERYNSERDDPNDPYPEVFLDALNAWTKEGLSFVMDIDPTKQVWNFPYDQAKVFESSKPPQGFNAAGLPDDGSVKYYHIDMAGTGFDAKIRNYECYIQRDGSGKVMKSAWIKTPNTHNHPDFMWRPHPVGDLREESMWVARSKSSNPEVDAQIKKIYEIYWKSMA